MQHAVIKSLAVGAILSIAVAACSSSGSTSSTPSSTGTGKPLVVDDTPISPMTDTFNPYSATSTGHVVTADALYNQPLFIWNTLNPSQAPFDLLGTGYTWSNGGKTLTNNTRSAAKWNDGKPVTAGDQSLQF